MWQKIRYDGIMLATRPQNVRTMATVKPWNVRVKPRHPRVSALVRTMHTLMNSNGKHGNLFTSGYERFGEEMEAALRSLSRRPNMVDFVDALPDPWMMVGLLESELSPEFLELWGRFRVPDRSNALELLGCPLPSRLAELLGWMGKSRLSVYPDFFSGNDIGDDSRAESWANTIGFSISDREWSSKERDRFSVTEDDLYALMDAGVQVPIPLGEHGSLQDELAKVQGKFTAERRALSRADFWYPPLSEEQAARFPNAARFFELCTESAESRVKASVDVEQFDSILEGSEGLSLNAMRERLAYNLTDVADLHGRSLSQGQQHLWGRVLELSAHPERHFLGVWSLGADDGTVETVLSWMSGHERRTPDGTSGWLSWVMLPEDESVSWNHTHLLFEDGLPHLLQVIQAGASWEQVHHALAVERLSVSEMVEVLAHGTPVDYVRAMR